MSKLKKSLLFCVSFVLALSFLITPLPTQNHKHTFSAVIEMVDEALLNYVSISADGQTLTNADMKNVDTDEDGKIDKSFVYTNRTATVSFKPFEYNYDIVVENEDYFYKEPEKSIVLTKLETDEDFPSSFTIDGQEISYTINEDDEISIRNETINSSFSNSPLIRKIADTPTTRTFYYITSYTLKTKLSDNTIVPATYLQFTPYKTGWNATKQTQYQINFEHPVANFGDKHVTLFTFSGLDGGADSLSLNKIERELSYENMKFQIINNDYTENNPLYFDINNDGFVYTFKLFSKEIESEEYLFVEYFDEQRPLNNRSLATQLDSEGKVINVGAKYDDGGKLISEEIRPVYKYISATTDFNTFSMDFNKTGRYEISVYDETYKLGLKDNNFYSTSFYIKTSDSTNENSAFENAYAILQNYDEEGNLLDYIVSGSTQNSNVQITLKNLLFYFENDAVIKALSDEESQTLNVVEFIKTTLTGSLNIPVSTYYSVASLQELLAESPDFIIDCSDDAFYEIIIYQYNKEDNGSFTKKDETSYQFTIVKQPKISFTVFKIDQDNDPIPIPGTNKFETEIREADVPYTITPVEYRININSDMEFLTFFKNPSQATPKPLILDKTYLNEYTINYAMQAVKIEQVDVMEPGTTNVSGDLGIQFFGVGDISVTITVDSITTNYTLQSGDQLSFADYGIYSVSIEDSMGTVATAVFKFTKPVSTSAIILFSLIGVIVLAVALFVISSRGKMKTR